MIKFGRNKRKRKVIEDDDNEKWDGQVARTERKKSMFAFLCSPSIHMDAKTLAKQLHTELYIVAEHAMQLGLMDIAEAMKDPEELEILRAHLHTEHVIDHLVESVSQYDAEAAQYIREGQSLIHQKERAVRDLVDLSVRYRLDPRLLRDIILQELRRRATSLK